MPNDASSKYSCPFCQYRESKGHVSIKPQTQKEHFRTEHGLDPNNYLNIFVSCKGLGLLRVMVPPSIHCPFDGCSQPKHTWGEAMVAHIRTTHKVVNENHPILLSRLNESDLFWWSIQKDKGCCSAFTDNQRYQTVLNQYQAQEEGLALDQDFMEEVDAVGEQMENIDDGLEDRDVEELGQRLSGMTAFKEMQDMFYPQGVDGDSRGPEELVDEQESMDHDAGAEAEQSDQRPEDNAQATATSNDQSEDKRDVYEHVQLDNRLGKWNFSILQLVDFPNSPHVLVCLGCRVAIKSREARQVVEHYQACSQKPQFHENLGDQPDIPPQPISAQGAHAVDDIVEVDPRNIDSEEESDTTDDEDKLLRNVPLTAIMGRNALSAAKRRLEEFLKEYIQNKANRIDTINADNYPKQPIPQVLILGDPRAGWRCPVQGCGYVMSEPNHYGKHYRQTHNNDSDDYIRPISCQYQSLYGYQTKTPYFAVLPRSAPTFSSIGMEQAMKEVLSYKVSDTNLATDGAQHYHLVLKKFQFHTLFPQDQSIIGEFIRKRFGIASIVSRQQPRSHQLIAISLFVYAMQSREVLQQTNHLVRRHLGNKSQFSELERAGGQEFRVVSKFVTRQYAAFMAKWVMYIVKVSVEPEIDEGLQLCESHKQAAIQLHQLAENEVASNNLQTALGKVHAYPDEAALLDKAPYVNIAGWSDLILPAVDRISSTLHKLLFSLVTEPDNNAVTSSLQLPLPRFVALSSWSTKHNTFHQPFDMGQSMAELQYMMRLVIFKEFKNRTSIGEADPLVVLQQLHDAHLTELRLHPFGTLRGYLSFTSAVSSRMAILPNAIWNGEDESLTYNGLSIKFTEFKDLLRALMIECKCVLYDIVLFGLKDEIFGGAEGVYFGRPKPIADETRKQDQGYSYFQNEQFAKYQDRLSDVISHTPAISKQFFISTNRNEGAPPLNIEGCIQWLANVDRLVDYIAVLTWFLGGMPARGPEHVSTRIKNIPGALRNLYLFLNVLAIVINYTKTEEKTNTGYSVQRFQAYEVQEVIEVYVAVVRPLQEALHARLVDVIGYPFDRARPLLFTKKGRPYTSKELSKSLCELTFKHTLHPWGIRPWRQIVILISLCKLPDHIQRTPLTTTALAAQASHRQAAANQHYGRLEAGTTLDVGNAQYRQYRTVSLAWQSLLGFKHPHLEDPLENHHHQLSRSDSAIDPATLTRIADSIATKVNSIQKDEILDVMGTFLEQINSRFTRIVAQNLESQRPPVQMRALSITVSMETKRLFLDLLKSKGVTEFRSPEQGQAVEYVLQRRANPLLAILPMGYGKTAIYLTAVKKEVSQGLVTIVLVPLVSLATAATLTAQQLGLAAIHLGPSTEPFTDPSVATANVVVMTYDLFTTSKPVTRWLLTLSNQERLARIVVDECHCLVTDESFRVNFKLVYNSLAASSTSLVFLTGTLPPYEMEKLRAVCNLHTAFSFVRLPLEHPQLKYVVDTLVATTESMKEFCKRVEEIIIPTLQANNKDRAIIFTRTKAFSDTISSELGCPGYHSAKPAGYKDHALKTWLDVHSEHHLSHILVSTSSLELGIDYAHVRHVWMFGDPYSIIQFAQMATRGGRDGRPTEIRLFPSQDTEASADDKVTLDGFKNASDCRRDIISTAINGTSLSCACLPNAQLCDICDTAAPTTPHPIVAEKDLMEVYKTRLQIRQYTLSYLVDTLYKGLDIFSKLCPYCAFQWDPCDHPPNLCPKQFLKHRKPLRTKLDLIGKNNRIPGLAICIHCHFPQSRHIPGAMEAHLEHVDRQGQPCSLSDLAIDMLIALLATPSLQSTIFRNIPRQNPQDILKHLFSPVTQPPCSSSDPHQQVLLFHLVLLSAMSRYQYITEPITELVDQNWFEPWRYVPNQINDRPVLYALLEIGRLPLHQASARPATMRSIFPSLYNR